MFDLRIILKRNISVLLTVLTIASLCLNPLTSYADGLSGDNDGGNASGTGTGGSGAAWSTWDGNGYRFYLVDSDFNQITKAYDFTYNNKQMNRTTTRFSNTSFGAEHRAISDLAALCGAPGTDMTKYLPVTATSGTQGKDFIEWFQGDWSGSVGTGNRNNQHVSPSSTSSSGKGISKTRPGPATSTISIEQNNGRTILGTGKAVYGRLANKASTGAIYLASARAAARGLQSAFNRSWALNIEKYSGSEMDALYYTLDCYYRNRVNASINKNDLLSDDDYKKLVIYYLYSNADSEVMFNNSNLLNTNIPLASGAGIDSPAVAFLSTSADKGGIDVSGYTKNGQTFASAFYAIRDGDCKLIIEPLLGVDVKGKSGKLYGSCWNITKYLTENGYTTSAMMTLRQRYFVTIYVDQDWTINGAVKVKQANYE